MVEEKRVRFAQRISKGFGNDIAVAFVFWILGHILLVIEPTLPATLPVAGVGIGLSSAIAIELGKDQ